MSWSLRVNWQRLTSTHDDGDPRLTALAPIQGVRYREFLLLKSQPSPPSSQIILNYINMAGQ